MADRIPSMPAPDEARAISLTVLPDGSALLEVGDESIVVNAVELERLKAVLAQEPTKRQALGGPATSTPETEFSPELEAAADRLAELAGFRCLPASTSDETNPARALGGCCSPDTPARAGDRPGASDPKPSDLGES